MPSDPGMTPDLQKADSVTEEVMTKDLTYFRAQVPPGRINRRGMHQKIRSCVSILFLLGGFVKSKEIFGAHGVRGGLVEIECSYPDGYRDNEKYWCRHPCWNTKDVLITTGKRNTMVTVGRFSLFDNQKVRTFTVTMNNLTLQDTGVYYCGLERWGLDKYTEIKVSVSPGKEPPGLDSGAQTNGSALADAHVVILAVLAVIVCGLLVAAVILFTQRRAIRFLVKNLPIVELPKANVQNDDVPLAVYEEVDAGGARPLSSVYSSVSNLQEKSQGLYSFAQLPGPQLTPEDRGVYSLVTAR
uniref:Immunoglobulin domain-containing protein n=2 Tax=Lepisosteus oculatus TaxID=7918 RepID=W5MVQ3_LEPOC